MNKINIHTKNNSKNTSKKMFVTAIALVVALALISSPLMASTDDAYAAHKKKNKAEQSIEQSQSSSQNGQCLSGGNTIFSCNNLSLQGQFNSGNNALGQGGNGNGGSNSAEQSISQSQSSSQNSQVVSGGDTIGSGNNVNVQSQVNTGNNAAAQQ
ncbi:MAG: hypothetical protein H0X03_06785 [Nitrosopumilus sp.]|nr:hypothetical protein [Nitrosopumilus sp.]